MRRREYGWLRRGLLSPVRTPHRKNREEPRPRGSQGFPCYGGKDNVCASALTLGSSSYEDEIAAGTVNKCTLTVSGHLLRNHSDRPEPNLHQLRPSRNWKLRAPQSKRMPALRIQMHLHGDAGVLQCDVVSQRVVYTVHVVILRLQQNVGGVWRVTWRSGFNPSSLSASGRCPG